MESEHAPAQSSILKVGLPLQLVIGSGQDTVNCGSTLLGWRERAWLICEWPFHFGQAVPCETGTRCLVRSMVGGKLVAYQSEVCMTQMSPLPLLYLAFPRRTEEIHLRKDARVASNEPLLLRQGAQGGAMVALPNGSPPIGGLLQDLSLSGCRIILKRAPGELVLGAMVYLEFELIGIGHVSHLAGAIKNIAECDGALLLGIEFRFTGKESIEFRGWGGNVQKAIEYSVIQRQTDWGFLTPPSEP
ncbi:MAG: flagellar brake protein [Nitrospira sp. CG24E]|nr:MAG: flagellar brake protein [Nitrospira sp. CG24E]